MNLTVTYVSVEFSLFTVTVTETVASAVANFDVYAYSVQIRWQNPPSTTPPYSSMSTTSTVVPKSSGSNGGGPSNNGDAVAREGNRIALGVGIGIGLPTLIAALVASSVVELPEGPEEIIRGRRNDSTVTFESLICNVTWHDLGIGVIFRQLSLFTCFLAKRSNFAPREGRSI